MAARLLESLRPMAPNNTVAPRISVCIPTYNGEKFLRECIESVLEQTFRDFEVVVVDDCSSDGTVAIVNEYAAGDPRIRVIRNEQNLGLVGNWNRCVELARGEWIKFVFQDDLLMPACLERMLQASCGHAGLISCRRKLIFEEGTTARSREWYLQHASMVDNLFSTEHVVSPERCQDLAVKHPGSNLFGEPTAVMLHRTVFPRFGLFNATLIMSCDLEYWTRVAINTGAICVPEELASFRVHQASASSANLDYRKYRTDTLDSLIIFHDYVYHPLYAPVRRAALAMTQPVDLYRQFRQRCHEAVAVARSAACRSPNPDRSLLAEWRDVSRIYPKMAVGNSTHFLWRLNLRLKRIFRTSDA
jgi:glycosyltransferase involved in cell wall biosynthesis